MTKLNTIPLPGQSNANQEKKSRRKEEKKEKRKEEKRRKKKQKEEQGTEYDGLLERAKARGGKESLGERASGFVKWEGPGNYFEGFLEEIWESEFGPVGAFVVYSINVPVSNSEDDMDILLGDRVNISLTTTALKCITEDAVGKIVTLVYKGDIPSKRPGHRPMRDITVVTREPSSEDQSDDGLPF